MLSSLDEHQCFREEQYILLIPETELERSDDSCMGFRLRITPARWKHYENHQYRNWRSVLQRLIRSHHKIRPSLKQTKTAHNCRRSLRLA